MHNWYIDAWRWLPYRPDTQLDRQYAIHIMGPFEIRPLYYSSTDSAEFRYCEVWKNWRTVFFKGLIREAAKKVLFLVAWPGH